MKEVLGTFADGQIEMYKKGIEAFDRLVPVLERIR